MLENSPDVLYYLAVSTVVKFVALYWSRDRRPPNAHHVGKVQALYLYPLKSARPVSLDRLHCGYLQGPHNGLLADRNWMVTTAKYGAISYKQHPELSTVEAKILDGQLVLCRPGHPSSPAPLTVDIAGVESTGRLVTARAYKNNVKGYDCGDVPAKWINQVLQGTGYRLVYAPPSLDTGRSVPGGNPNYDAWTKGVNVEEKMKFGSTTPYHVITQQSLDDLNSRLDRPVQIDRFRPTIVVGGASVPYAEDSWKDVFIGQTRFSTVKLTGRCTFVNIDPATGNSDSQTLAALMSYRKVIPELGPIMGTNLALECPGMIRVGDEVYAVTGDNTIKPCLDLESGR